MSPDKKEKALVLAKESLVIAKKYKDKIETIICPSFIHLNIVQKYIKEPIYLGAQDVSESDDIQNTGLISISQLIDMNVKYVILGHSEIRKKGEGNDIILLKTQKVLSKKITPIICVGETQRDDQGFYLSEIKDQVDTLINGLAKNAFKKIILAYEPVWAIGKNAIREATPLECREMVIYIKKLINDAYGEKYSKDIKIVYGGSVNENNANLFIQDGGVDGLLLGRVSLDSKRLANLVKNII